jgi:hypothetical protein
MMDNL